MIGKVLGVDVLIFEVGFDGGVFVVYCRLIKVWLIDGICVGFIDYFG